MLSCKVIADSINCHNKRITTLEVTYPKIIHAEMLTHRAFARNSASSRAIPFSKTLQLIESNPFFPFSFDAEQPGMQSGEPVVEQDLARFRWNMSFAYARMQAKLLHKMGVHKSICNRLLEPFSWITVIITATEWKNFFRLRCHPAAEKHMRAIALMMEDALDKHTPNYVNYGDWHLPYITPEDKIEARLKFGSCTAELKKISVGRCARVSYLTHDGKRDLYKDIELHDKLLNPPDDESIMHASPFEHVATPSLDRLDRSGPFIGWNQYRKEFPKENHE